MGNLLSLKRFPLIFPPFIVLLRCEYVVTFPSYTIHESKRIDMQQHYVTHQLFSQDSCKAYETWKVNEGAIFFRKSRLVLLVETLTILRGNSTR